MIFVLAFYVFLTKTIVLTRKHIPQKTYQIFSRFLIYFGKYVQMTLFENKSIMIADKTKTF